MRSYSPAMIRVGLETRPSSGRRSNVGKMPAHPLPHGGEVRLERAADRAQPLLHSRLVRAGEVERQDGVQDLVHLGRVAGGGNPLAEGVECLPCPRVPRGARVPFHRGLRLGGRSAAFCGVRGRADGEGGDRHAGHGAFRVGRGVGERHAGPEGMTEYDDLRQPECLTCFFIEAGLGLGRETGRVPRGSRGSRPGRVDQVGRHDAREQPGVPGQVAGLESGAAGQHQRRDAVPADLVTGLPPVRQRNDLRHGSPALVPLLARPAKRGRIDRRSTPGRPASTGTGAWRSAPVRSRGRQATGRGLGQALAQGQPGEGRPPGVP